MDVATLGFKVDSAPLATAGRDMDTLAGKAKRLESASARMDRQFERNQRTLASLSGGLDRVTRNVMRLAGAFLTIQGARQIGQMADAYTNLTSKIRNVTSSEQELARVQSHLYDISQRTRQEYVATGELYTRLTRATKDLGLAESSRLRITETINKAFVVEGASAAAASAAITQLSQGLASGALRGDEFNSVAEQAPLIMDMLTKSLGVTRGELRAMAAEGQITADVLVTALAAGAEDVDRQFANMTATMGQSFTVLENSMMNFVGGADETAESSRAVADAVLMIAEAIDLVSPQVNALIGLWRAQATEQGNVSITAEDIARAMKTVVTGLVIAKNGADVLIVGLKALVKIGLTAAVEIGDAFSDLSTNLPQLMETLRNPFTMSEGIDMFGEMMDRAQGRLDRFVAEGAAAGNEFAGSFEEDVADVANVFAFLNEPMKRTILDAADTAAGISTVGASATQSAEDIAGLANANRAMADLLGRLQGELSPTEKAWADYGKAIRTAEAIGAKMIKHGEGAAKVQAYIARATDLATQARVRSLDALKQVAAIERANSRADFLKETQLLAAELEGPLAVALLENSEAMERLNDQFFEGVISAAEAGDAAADLAEKLRRTKEEIEANSEEGRWLQSIMDEYNNTSFDGLRAEIERVGEALEEAFKKGGPEIDALQEKLGRLRQTQLEGIVGASQAALRSMQTMTEEGSKAYKAMEIASHALNVVMAIGAVLNQGKGDPYTAFARMAAMAVAVAGLVGSISANFGGGPSGASAAERQAAQGAGTVLGDAEAQSESIQNALDITADATSELVGINRGMLNALQAMQRGIGAASGSLARVEFGDISLAEGAATNAIFGPLGSAQGQTVAGRIISSIFGGEQDLIDQGLLIGGGLFGDVAANPNASSYQTIETDGGWFGSDDIDDQLVALGEGAVNQISLILESLGDAVLEGAIALGLNAEEVAAAIAAYEIEAIRISTMDLSAEEQQAELEAVFSSIFDGLAGSIVPFIAQFQRVGEGLGETLVRVATGVQVTQEALTRLGFSLEETGPEAFAQISESLIDLVGGIEAFIEGMSSFIDKFAPEAHKFELLQSDLTRALEQSGLAVPATRDAMWELMQSLDATTESGREQIATLLRLAGTADAYYSQIERATEQAERAAQQAADAAADAAAEAERVAQEAADAFFRAIVQAAEEEAQRLDAFRNYAEAVGALDDQMSELGGASAFQMSLRDIAAAWQTNVDQLNDLAQAAGLAGAREEDLGRAMALATMQRMKAIAALEAEGRALVESLGFGPLGMLDAEIAALEERESAATSAISSFGDAMGEAANAASEAIQLLLGDLSPLRDRKKLDIALQALQAGQIGQEDVLQIGRHLFASGADYNRLFAQVTAIGDRRTSGDTGGGSIEQGVSSAMQRLLDEREGIMAQQNAAARFGQASDLAQVIADLAGARGEDFEAVARSLGLTGLDQLLTDLRLDSVQGLTDYLTALQADSYSLDDLRGMITAGEQAIVDTLREIFDNQIADSFVPIEGGKPPGFDQPPIDFMEKSARDDHAELVAELRGMRAELDEIKQNTARSHDIADSTADTARALDGIAANAARGEAYDLTMKPRSTRGLPA